MNAFTLSTKRLLCSLTLCRGSTYCNIQPAFVQVRSHKDTLISIRSFHKTLNHLNHPIDFDSSDSYENGAIMDLKKVVKTLKTFAPTTLAADWDNVGLLIEPTPPHSVTSMLLTNDLTLPVLEEAIEKQVNLVFSYHPPIFVPLKRLTQRTWKEVIALRCAENRIAVYSPHTASDAVQGGVNDWLLEPFSSGGKVEVIEKSYETSFPLGGGYRLECSIPADLAPKAQKDVEIKVTKLTGITLVSKQSVEGCATRLCVNCTEKSLPKVMHALANFPDIKSSVEIFKTEKPPLPHTGQGRLCKLSEPVSLQDAVEKIKQHLGLRHVRVATAVGKSYESLIKSVAVCAGSGGSVLKGVEADLYITGELFHHDILDATHHGVSVILCDHSNTERGYLTRLQGKLSAALDEKVDVIMSERDRDPLEVV